MSPSRNDPCPCGSGKKYKRCCMANEAEAGHPFLSLLRGSPGRGDRAERLGIEPGTPVGARWEADLVPINAGFEDDPAARPAVNLIVSDDFVLAADIVTRPPAEHDAIAAVIAEGIEQTAVALGRRPRVVETRDLAIATALGELLRTSDIEVALAPLPGLDRAFESLRQNVLGGGRPGRFSAPQRWAGWGWEAEAVAALFTDMASYYRAAPWKTVGDDEVLTIDVDRGRTWHAVVMGQAGETYGLALYEDERDLDALYSGEATEDSLAEIEGMVLSLTFGRFDELPRGMHKEIRAEGWEVAGPRAYPVLIAMNTPGGGITRQQLGDLGVVLRAIPPFLVAHRDAFEESFTADVYPRPIDWTDPASGARISYIGSWDVEVPNGLWPIPQELEIAETTGKGARPGERLGNGATRTRREKAEQERLGRYFDWLLSGPGSGSPAAREKSANYHLGVAANFARSVMVEGVTVRGMNEHDLRVHLYGNYALEARRNADHGKMLKALGRFFRFLEEEEGIVCPWAWPILGDLERLAIRASTAPRTRDDPGKTEWFEELMDDLSVRLLRPVVETLPAGRELDAEGELEWLRWWLARRDEIIRGGERRPERVLELLLEGEKAPD